MGTYEATAHSNYVCVRDQAAFRAWCDALAITVVSHDTNPILVGMLFADAIPRERDGEGIDFEIELAAHLVPGQIAVLIEVGHEKQRYLVGYATAVNASGTCRSVVLDDIYDLIDDLRSTDSPTIVERAEY
jgi:hypothetical protein